MFNIKTLAALPLTIALIFGLGACGDNGTGDQEKAADTAPASSQSAGKAEEIRGKVLDTTAKTGEMVGKTTETVAGAIDSAKQAAESRIAEPSVNADQESEN